MSPKPKYRTGWPTAGEGRAGEGPGAMEAAGPEPAGWQEGRNVLVQLLSIGAGHSIKNQLSFQAAS